MTIVLRTIALLLPALLVAAPARGDGCAPQDPKAHRGERGRAELSPRRDAGAVPRRLQLGNLPRFGTRQGRIHAVAVRLRSQGRLLPHHSRNGRPPGESSPCPRESLLLFKATGKVPHTGGELIHSDSSYYRTL